MKMYFQLSVQCSKPALKTRELKSDLKANNLSTCH